MKAINLVLLGLFLICLFICCNVGQTIGAFIW